MPPRFTDKLRQIKKAQSALVLAIGSCFNALARKAGWQLSNEGGSSPGTQSVSGLGIQDPPSILRCRYEARRILTVIMRRRTDCAAVAARHSPPAKERGELKLDEIRAMFDYVLGQIQQDKAVKD